MSSFHIYVHYKQERKEKLVFPNDVNYSREEVEEIVRKYESGEDFLLGGFTVHPDPSHIRKFEIWETSSSLPPPVDWNNMWKIGRLVTKKFTTLVPGARSSDTINKEHKENAQVNENHTEWDLFICHAGEDKDEIVRPLANALTEAGFRVWYDEFTLTLGDNLRRKIDEGLAQSRYGLVILSQNFFKKNWPQTELDGLAAKERDGKKVILPVWHNVDRKYVLKFSPTLADRLAVLTEEGIDKVVEEVLRAVKPSKTRKTAKVSATERLKELISSLKEKNQESIKETVSSMEFDDLRRMFLDVLDGVALFDLPYSSEHANVFNFILMAVLQRNKEEGAKLFEILLNWFFGTVTPSCKDIMLKIFAHLTKASYLKKVVSDAKMTSSFVAEFAASTSYDRACLNSEILQNIKPFLSPFDCSRIVESALSNDQILYSRSAKEYLRKILSSCKGKIGQEKMEELYKKIDEQQ